MSEGRDEFRAWLDEGTPGEVQRSADADRVWSRRRRTRVGAWVVVAAASVLVGVWLMREPPRELPEPEFASRLVVSVADDEVSIEVGVRRKRDR
ncbi:MAG: hypothetical protein ACRBN8_04605 [Nannocystales bacterium]